MFLLLDRYIRIEVGTPGKNDLGTPIEVYNLLYETWSGVQFVGGRSAQDSHGENIVSDAIFTVRYDERINYKCRVYYEKQYYKITHIETMGRKEGLRLKTIMFTTE
jgi:head-tail adaptor